MSITQTINECGVITITPMEIECVVINPTTPTSNDGSASLSITGGTPPYEITWGNGSLGLAIYNLSVGDYPAIVKDYYGDFTANTTCVLTAQTTTTTSTTTTTTLKPLEDFCINITDLSMFNEITQYQMVGNGYDGNGNPKWISGSCEVVYNVSLSQWNFICPLPNGAQAYSTDSVTSNPPISNWFILGTPKTEISVVSGQCETIQTLNLASRVNQPTCECDGTISLTGSGGQPPYTYSINNGLTYQSNILYSNLCPGIYSVSVKDDDNNVVSDSVTLLNIQATSQYELTLNTISSILVNTPNDFDRNYMTTLSVSPPIPVGVTVTFDLTHTGIYKSSRKPGYSNLTRSVILYKNGSPVSVTSSVMVSTSESVLPQCFDGSHDVQVETTTDFWGGLSITNGDIITVETDSLINIPIPSPDSCDFGTDENIFQIGNATINGCDCCDVIITNPAENVQT